MYNYLRRIRRVLTVGAILGLVLVLFFEYNYGYHTPAYMVYIDGQPQFAIKDKEKIVEVFDNLKSTEQKKLNNGVDIDINLELKKEFVDRSLLVAAEDIGGKIQSTAVFQAAAAALVIDGNTMAYLESQAAAEKLLSDLKREFGEPENGEKLVQLAFQEDVEIQPATISANKVIEAQQAYNLITTGSLNPEKYVVKAGDSLWLIARRNDMYVDEIAKANHLDNAELQLGQELILNKNKPYLNVVATFEGERTEPIPFETVIETDSKSYDKVKIRQEGKEGQKYVVYNAVKVNGVVTEREVKKENIIAQAVNRVIVKGTNVQMASVSRSGGTGSLDWPVYGTMTQYFGRYHTGLDIAGKTGTPIQAADSGIVVFAGWNGGYGNYVIIDHGNGLKTHYAHNSSLTVTVGQGVTKGETIAKLGSTGHSTGPHLHFEVSYGGQFVNPRSYLR